MAKRVAFLIGNQTFRPESGLLPLQGPANDVAALVRLLGDPKRGKFEIHEFLDKPCYEVLPDLAHALGDAVPGDFFLVYYSGHGKLDRQGRLCLANADTRQGALLATSISARHLRDLVEESDCDQVVMLLDCCYSGAVDDGLRGDVGSELHVVEDARGFYIMTASTGLQAARETEVAPGGAVMGRFTAALVHGIESGAADVGRKGRILLSDLRHHLGQVIKGQTPQFFDRKAVGDPLISLSPGMAAPLLDAEVFADLDAEHWHRRRGAVSALAGILRAGERATRAAARAALQRRLGQEHNDYVRAELQAALAVVDIETSGLQPLTVPSTATPDPFPAEAKASLADPVRADAAPEGHTCEASEVEALLGQSPRELGTTLGKMPGSWWPIALVRPLNLRSPAVAVAGSALVAMAVVVGFVTSGGQPSPPPSPTQSSVRPQVTSEVANCDYYWFAIKVRRKTTSEQQVGAGAAQACKLAADQGDSDAQFTLGWLYEHGHGVQESKNIAVDWYLRAARQDNRKALEALRRLRQPLTWDDPPMLQDQAH